MPARLGSETEKDSFSSQEVRARFEVGRSFTSQYGAGATITPIVALASVLIDAAVRHGGDGAGAALGGDHVRTIRKLPGEISDAHLPRRFIHSEER